MRKRIAMIYTEKGECKHRNEALILVSASFLLGGLLGYLACEKTLPSPYVQTFLRESLYNTSVQQELWSTLRWPFGLLILQLFPLAGLSIPTAMLLRGFFLSYSISAYTEVSITSAVLLFGPNCILTLPILFILSTELLLRKAGASSECKPVVTLACLLSLCLYIVFDLTLVPMLLR